MKKGLLTLLLILSSAVCAAAQRETTASIRVGEQKTVAGRLKIHFQEVIDDSRCPIGTTCVWAGNAKVKLTLSVGRKRRDFELNSNLAPTSIDYNGYRVKLQEQPFQALVAPSQGAELPVPSVHSGRHVSGGRS